MYLQLAAEHGLAVRSFANWTDETRLAALVARVEREQGVRLPVDTEALPAQLRSVAAEFAAPRTTDGWLDSFNGSSTSQEVLTYLQGFAGQSLEWMCHPALSADGRRRECELLTSPEMLEAVTREWELTTFGSL